MPGTRERLARPSMQVAAARLKTVSALPIGPRWLEDARDAVRTAIVAVEEELGAVSGAGGFGEQVVDEAPRLVPQIERLEAGLAEVLVGLWQAKQTVDDGSVGDSLTTLSRRVQTLAEDGFALAYESLTTTGGED